MATALREAHEELGIAPHDVRVLGCLPPFLSKHLLSVTPVVGVVPAGLRFTPSPAEVDAVFTAPLRMFLSAERHRHQDVEWKHGVAYRCGHLGCSSGAPGAHLGQRAPRVLLGGAKGALRGRLARQQAGGCGKGAFLPA